MRMAILVILFLFLFVWNMTLQVAVNHSLLSNFLFNLSLCLINFYVLFLAVTGLNSNDQTPIDKGIKFIGLGIGSWGIGGIIWSTYNLYLNVEIPYPSLADVFFVAYIPLLITGLIKIISIYKQGLNTSLIIKAVLIMIASFLFSIFWVSAPEISLEVPLLARILNLAYPTGDAIFVALSYILFKLSAGGKIQKAFLIFAIASITQAAADYLFSYRSSTGTYWNGDISDLLFMTSATLFGYGIIKFKQLFFS